MDSLGRRVQVVEGQLKALRLGHEMMKLEAKAMRRCASTAAMRRGGVARSQFFPGRG